MLSVASASIEKDQPEQYEMRFRELSAVQSKNDYFKMDPRKLKVEPGFNIRDLEAPHNRAHIDDLKASIKVNGVRKPIEVRMEGKHAFVVDGHCRLQAVLELISDGLDIRTIPAIPEAEGTDVAERTLNVLIAGTGRRPEPLEVATGVKRLLDFGWAEKDIAARLGWKSTKPVKYHLELLTMAQPMKEAVRDSKVSATNALRISKNADPEFAEKLLKENEEENKKIRGTGKKQKKITPRKVRQATEAAKPKPETVSTSEPQVPTPQTPVAVPEPAPREALQSADHVTDEAAPYSETVSLLIALTREANSILAHNKSDDNPGYWTREFEDAIQDALAHIEQITGKPMEFETLPDATSQVVEEV